MVSNYGATCSFIKLTCWQREDVPLRVPVDDAGGQGHQLRGRKGLRSHEEDGDDGADHPSGRLHHHLSPTMGAQETAGEPDSLL